MERRKIIQLLAGALAGLYVTCEASTRSLLEAAVSQGVPRAEPLLPLFPLDIVLFPQTDLPLHIYEPRYKEMIQDCLQNKWEFGVLLAQGQQVERIGCTASITEILKQYPDGEMDIMTRGRRRFEMSAVNKEKSYLRGEATFFDDDEAEAPPIEDARQRALRLYSRLTELAERDHQPLQGPPPTADNPQLSFRMMAGLPADADWKQHLLGLRSERERLVQVVEFFENFIKLLEDPPDHSPDSIA